MHNDFDLQDLDLVAEVRKHPGMIAGAVAVLAGIGVATILLSQRTGPRRYEVLMDRFDPRGWVDTDALRDRLGQFGSRVQEDAEDLGHRASERARKFRSQASERAHEAGDRAYDLGLNLSDRARDLADSARERFDEWRDAPRRRRKSRRYAKQARRAAEDARDYASDFAKDHVKEGSAVLAVALIAAAVGAMALEQKRKSAELSESVRRVVQ